MILFLISKHTLTNLYVMHQFEQEMSQKLALNPRLQLPFNVLKKK